MKIFISQEGANSNKKQDVSVILTLYSHNGHKSTLLLVLLFQINNLKKVEEPNGTPVVKCEILSILPSPS